MWRGNQGTEQKNKYTCIGWLLRIPLKESGKEDEREREKERERERKREIERRRGRGR
jgi:hypothetical protein